jgi:RNA polymerase sigma factor (sigma-70 family)
MSRYYVDASNNVRDTEVKDEYDTDARVEVNAFTSYMRDVDKLSRLTNEQQSDLQQDCRDGYTFACLRLAEQATLIVAYVVAKMRRAGKLPTISADDLDAVQEGNYAALIALRKWDPAKGTLGTWLVPQIRGSLLNYANTHLNAGIGSKHTRVIRTGLDETVAYDEIPASQDEPGAEQAIPLSLEESLSYDRPVLPEPESASEHQKLTEAISRLPPFLREVLVLNLWGNSVQEIADAIGTSHETARRRLQAAIEAVSVDLS